MSKADQIIASNTRMSRSWRKSGFFGYRGRVALLTLTTLLILFVCLTQPDVRAVFESWANLSSG